MYATYLILEDRIPTEADFLQSDYPRLRNFLAHVLITGDCKRPPTQAEAVALLRGGSNGKAPQQGLPDEIILSDSSEGESDGGEDWEHASDTDVSYNSELENNKWKREQAAAAPPRPTLSSAASVATAAAAGSGSAALPMPYLSAAHYINTQLSARVSYTGTSSADAPPPPPPPVCTVMTDLPVAPAADGPAPAVPWSPANFNAAQERTARRSLRAVRGRPMAKCLSFEPPGKNDDLALSCMDVRSIKRDHSIYDNVLDSALFNLVVPLTSLEGPGRRLLERKQFFLPTLFFSLIRDTEVFQNDLGAFTDAFNKAHMLPNAEIILPIATTRGGSHYVMALLRPSSREIFIVDSTQSNLATIVSIEGQLIRWLEFEAVRLGVPYPAAAAPWRVFRKPAVCSIVQQRTTNSCAIFTLLNIYYYVACGRLPTDEQYTEKVMTPRLRLWLWHALQQAAAAKGHDVGGAGVGAGAAASVRPSKRRVRTASAAPAASAKAAPATSAKATPAASVISMYDAVWAGLKPLLADQLVVLQQGAAALAARSTAAASATKP